MPLGHSQVCKSLSLASSPSGQVNTWPLWVSFHFIHSSTFTPYSFQVSLDFCKLSPLHSLSVLTSPRNSTKNSYSRAWLLLESLVSLLSLHLRIRVGSRRGQAVSTRYGTLAMPRSMYISLLVTTYSVLRAKPHRYIPIIASVSEHQPTAWPSFFMDLHFLIFLFPAGVVLCFRSLRDEHIFVIIYAVMASYFAGVMVRLMLTLTPVVCVASAIALSSLLDTYLDSSEPDVAQPNESPKQTTTTDRPDGASLTTTPSAAASSKKAKKSKDKSTAAASGGAIGELVSGVASSAAAAVQASDDSTSVSSKGIFGFDTRLTVLVNAICLLLFFVIHCTWVTSNAYSSPSVVLASTNPDGSQHLIDDFREAYYWLRQNTPEDAVVMSWWDYGYQIAGMADRPTLVDNNTWNNSRSLSLFKSKFS